MKKKTLYIIITLILATILMTLISVVSIKWFASNVSMFAFLSIVAPMLVIATAAFAIGRIITWNWKKGLCFALVLALLSFGTGQLSALIIGDDLNNVVTEEASENIDDELMSEIYDELDRQAYQYMLEQGLISEGDEIYGGERIGDGQNAGNSENGSDAEDNTIVRSELYIGIQKSDPATEMLGSMMDFALAFAFGFIGHKTNRRKSSTTPQNEGYRI